MTKPAKAPRQTGRVVQLRKGTTLEMVRLSCPDAHQAGLISESFGLAVLDSDGIRDLHERLIVETADALRTLIHAQARKLARYRCSKCGFRAREFHWQCPGCSQWDTYAPKRIEELDSV